MIIWRCLYHLAFCFNIWQLQSSFISFLDERLDWLYQKLLSLNKSFRKLFNWTKKNCYQLKLMKMTRIVYECKDNMCKFSFKKKFQFYIYRKFPSDYILSHIFLPRSNNRIKGCIHLVFFLVHEAQFNVKFENHMSMG